MWTSENRCRYDRSHQRYESDLTETEWGEIEPLIPPAKRGGNKRTVDIRQVTNGVMYILSTGCQWRAHPEGCHCENTKVWPYCLAGAGFGLQLADLAFGTNHHEVFDTWWEIARRDYLHLDGDEPPPDPVDVVEPPAVEVALGVQLAGLRRARGEEPAGDPGEAGRLAHGAAKRLGHAPGHRCTDSQTKGRLPRLRRQPFQIMVTPCF